MNPHVEPVPVKSIEELGPVVTVAEMLGLYRLKNYGALLRRIEAKRCPGPFASRPMQFRKSDIVAQLSAVPTREQRSRSKGRHA